MQQQETSANSPIRKFIGRKDMIKFSYKRGLNRFRINTVLTKKLNVLNETKNSLSRNLSQFYNKKIYWQQRKPYPYMIKFSFKRGQSCIKIQCLQKKFSTSFMFRYVILKFGHSEKHTKFENIFHLNLTCTQQCQI